MRKSIRYHFSIQEINSQYFCLHGDMLFNNAMQIQEPLKNIANDKFVINLKHLNAIDSAGFLVLINALYYYRKIKKIEVKLESVNQKINDLVELYNLKKFFNKFL